MGTPILSFIGSAPLKHTFFEGNQYIFSRRRILSSRCHRLHYKQNENSKQRISLMSMSPDPQSDINKEFEEFASEVRYYLSAKSTPNEGPLAFEILQRAGRLDIMSGIIKYGGSMRVSEKMKIDPALFMPSLRAVESKTFPDFYRPEDGASLALGRELEARLEMADTIKLSDPSVRNDKNLPLRRVIDNVPSAEELKRQNESIIPRVIDDIVLPGETLSLTTEMRIGTLFLAALTALGYGHASAEILNSQVINTLRSLANGLLAAHFGLSIYTAAYLAPRLNRNSLLWLIKVLLSGPFGLRSLLALGAVEMQS